ncbi:unnamed protein product [Dovyalis caffra]|uniref:Uncharacterized protein n=1 Tax=Dovyalis caffra TaxID=77055 RepID=A0AAV1STX5_9ROSI|nr:unnamed protein product [Dovyalis caffra]
MKERKEGRIDRFPQERIAVRKRKDSNLIEIARELHSVPAEKNEAVRFGNSKDATDE